MQSNTCVWKIQSCWLFAVLLAIAAAPPLAAQQPKALGILRAKDNGVFKSLAFSPDGKTLASAWLWKMKIYDMAQGKTLADFDAHMQRLSNGKIEGTGTGVRKFTVAYRPDGKVIASVPQALHGRIILWDAATHKEIRKINCGGSYCLAFSPDGKTLACSGLTQYSEVQLWDAETGKRIAKLGKGARKVRLLAFSPDGKTLATVRQDGQISLWDPAARKKRRTLPITKGIASLAFSPDSKTLALGGSESSRAKVVLWDMAAGKATTLFKNPASRTASAVTDMIYTPDGKSLITAMLAKQIIVRDAATGRPISYLEGPDRFAAMALSRDGRIFAAGGDHIRLWLMPGAKKK